MWREVGTWSPLKTWAINEPTAMLGVMTVRIEVGILNAAGVAQNQPKPASTVAATIESAEATPASITSHSRLFVLERINS